MKRSATTFLDPQAAKRPRFGLGNSILTPLDFFHPQMFHCFHWQCGGKDIMMTGKKFVKMFDTLIAGRPFRYNDDVNIFMVDGYLEVADRFRMVASHRVAPLTNQDLVDARNFVIKHMLVANGYDDFSFESKIKIKVKGEKHFSFLGREMTAHELLNLLCQEDDFETAAKFETTFDIFVEHSDDATIITDMRTAKTFKILKHELIELKLWVLGHHLYHDCVCSKLLKYSELAHGRKCIVFENETFGNFVFFSHPDLLMDLDALLDAIAKIEQQHWETAYFQIDKITNICRVTSIKNKDAFVILNAREMKELKALRQ